MERARSNATATHQSLAPDIPTTSSGTSGTVPGTSGTVFGTDGTGCGTDGTVFGTDRRGRRRLGRIELLFARSRAQGSDQ